jgi:16S rRNA (cytidine1402-2'-O)-methyltransferase
VTRELTKLHETVYRGTLEELATRARGDANFSRGEITLVVEGAAAREGGADRAELRRVVGVLARELPPGKAAALAAQLTGAKRSEAYALIAGAQAQAAGAAGEAPADAEAGESGAQAQGDAAEPPRD